MLIGQWRIRGSVAARRVQGRHVVGDEIVGYLDAPAVGALMIGGRRGIGHHFDDVFVVVVVGGETVGIERRGAAAAVAGLEVEGAAVRLELHPPAASPDARQAVVGRGAKYAGDREAAR